MIKLVEQERKNELLKILYNNIEKCLYLTLDLEKYGLNNKNVHFYIEEDKNQMNMVLMKYYDTIHIFSENGTFDKIKLVDFIKKLNPIAICAEKKVIKSIEKYFPKNEVEYGVIINDNNYTYFKQFEKVERAKVSDSKEIATLMFSTEEFSKNNTLSTLEEQLQERIQNNIGESYVIREDNIIVAHTAIYAQNKKIAIESGLVVHEDYKKKFYGMIIHEYMKKLTKDRGQILYGIRYNEEMQIYAEQEGLEVKCFCGKILLK